MAMDFISFPAELAVSLAILVKPASVLLLGLKRTQKDDATGYYTMSSDEIAVNLFDRIFAS
jgi:hypothetical protein